MVAEFGIYTSEEAKGHIDRIRKVLDRIEDVTCKGDYQTLEEVDAKLLESLKQDVGVEPCIRLMLLSACTVVAADGNKTQMLELGHSKLPEMISGACITLILSALKIKPAQPEPQI